MKCISLWQPWATLWLLGVKCYETRSWHHKHTGPLLVHAATKWGKEQRQLCEREPFRSALLAAGLDPAHGFRDSLPRGCVVGVVDLTGWRAVEDLLGILPGGKKDPMLTERELAFGDFSRGRYAWMAGPRTLFRTPVPYPGRQLLFDVPDGLVPEIVRSKDR